MPCTAAPLVSRHGTYYLKRDRRTGPGYATGTLADEAKFRANSISEAETSVRRKFHSVVMTLDWEKDFAKLQEEHGHVIVEWLNGFAHA
jgi:hypothetical protein